MSSLEGDPWSLDGSTAKTFRLGTHRTLQPAETLQRARRFMAPLGITRIANVTGLDRIGVPVVMVCRPNSRSLSVAQGKGPTLEIARASGLMESIEAYHAEHIVQPLLLCSYEQLRYTHRTADPLELPRPRSKAFDSYKELLWIQGNDLLGDERVWLPYDLVHLNYTSGPWIRQRDFILSSNGLASGNHPLEALNHGICEVVERDAAKLWSLRSVPDRAATRLDLNTVSDAVCCSVLEKLSAAGIAAAVWDITSDVGVPAFRCVIAQARGNPLAPLPTAAGTGCHPSPSIALLRALTEAVQTRLTLIAGTRDDVTAADLRSYYEPVRIEADRAQVLTQTGRRPFGSAGHDGDSLESDVAWLLGKLRAADIGRVIAVDLTKPELQIPVVRVVIPGLEPSPLHTAARHGARARRVVQRDP